MPVKRILYVHNDYARPSGEEHSAKSIADLLRAHGHEVFWFRRSSAEISGSPRGMIKAFFAGINNPFAAKALAKELDRVRPDIVHVQNIYPLLSPSVFRPIRERRIPVVMRCPNYRLFCPTGLHLSNGEVCERCLGVGGELWCIFKNCEKNLFKSTGYALRNAHARIAKRITGSVDMFIVQTKFQKLKFAERGISEDRIEIVPGFVLPVSKRKERALGDLVTFVGRVSPEKGISQFLDAARAMPSVPFAIAGNSDGMPKLREGSPSNVQWLGFLRDSELDDLYNRSRIVVVPSLCYEGFPGVMVRAMSLGRPVVASRLGAMASVVKDNETGLLFEAGNPKDLAAKLSSLYCNENLCKELGAAAQKMASLEYCPEKVYDSLMNAYKSAAQHCLAGGRSAVLQHDLA